MFDTPAGNAGFWPRNGVPYITHIKGLGEMPWLDKGGRGGGSIGGKKRKKGLA